jgi:hypothetical protein
MSVATVITLGLRGTASELLRLGFGIGAATSIWREVVRLDSPICQATALDSPICRAVGLDSPICPAVTLTSAIDLEEVSA